MRLQLVRHGRTPANVKMLLDTAAPGSDLDEVGHAQARALVGRLHGQDIDAIYVSELTRTHQTAAPLGAALGLTPLVLPGLNEILAGEYEMSDDPTGYVGTLMGWEHTPEARIGGAENAHEFLARYDGAIASLAAAGHRSPVAISHGAAMRTWAAYRVTGFLAAVNDFGMPNTGIIQIEGTPDTGWTLIALDAPSDPH